MVITKSNDLNNSLTMENAIVEKISYNLHRRKHYCRHKCCNKSNFSLEGEYSVIYNTNAKMYVPAMKSLNGNVSGVEFENGKFNSDCFVKVYWDSIEKIGICKIRRYKQ